MRAMCCEWGLRLSRGAAAVAMAVMPGLAAAHVDYAVLFSGGGDNDINYPRYYDQTLRMWGILTGTLGFNPTNIYVLFADGTYSGEDQCTNGVVNPDGSWTCTAHADSDWSTVVAANSSVLMGTRDKLKDVLGFLDTAMSTDDSFYFWSFDHGDIDPKRTDPNDVKLVSWGGEIEDDELAQWVEPFDVKAEIYAFAQCFSGGMVDDLDLAANPNRFAAWAASGCEPSLGAGWADAWASGIEGGYRMTRDIGRYAADNDIYGPFGAACQANPDDCESPGYDGANIHIVTNEIPEPAALSLAALGLATLAGVRRRVSRGRGSPSSPLPADQAPAHACW